MTVLPEVRLTALATCAGCAAKLSPGDLAHVLHPLAASFNAVDHPALLVGLSAPDDAAVYQLSEDQAIISTVDFFPPVVDDPYSFGAIAAANALSDIYAMGGEVLFAINLVAFPETLDLAILSEILRGGADRVRAAGAAIAGGHTIKDDEPKYGLAVTGLLHPAQIITKGGAKPGDVLILTKRLGTGVITTALKRDLADPRHVDSAMAGMMTLNRAAARAARAVGVHAMTDITGYSLMGHGREMAALSGVDLLIDFAALPFLPGAEAYAEAGLFPGGAMNNVNFYTQWVTVEAALRDDQRMLLFDPQTSGGLLIALPPERLPAFVGEFTKEGGEYWQIGTVQAGSGRIIVR